MKLVIFIVGVLLALFVGFYVMLFGGIVNIVDAVQMEPVDSGRLAFGVVRIILAAPAGWLIFFIGTGVASTID